MRFNVEIEVLLKIADVLNFITRLETLQVPRTPVFPPVPISKKRSLITLGKVT